MAIELTENTQLKADAPIQLPQLVLEIDGVPNVYGVGAIKKYVRIGAPGLLIGDDWSIGGLNAYENQVDLIDLNGSSNSISQQLLQDKGGTSSVASIQMSLIDKNGLITELITPGLVVEDILGRKASVYLGYQETAWPQDFVKIFTGIIDEISGGPTIILNIAHPEQKKRTELFSKVTTKLTQDFKFRSEKIQHIVYATRRDVVGTVNITYIAGGTAGSEIVTVSGNNITVQIEVTNTKAHHIKAQIEKSIQALALIDLAIESGFSNESQVAQASTPLLSDTTINVETTKGFLLPEPTEGFLTYVRIHDEVIQYTGLTDTTLTGCTREAFALVDERSEGAHHKSGSTVDSFYRIQGSALDLVLKMLISGGPEYYKTGIGIKTFVEIEGVGSILNAFYIESINIQDAYGITIGDMVTIIDDINPTNNVVDALVEDIVSTPYGSYISLSGVTFIPNTTTEATVSFKSKWNVWPTGLGLGGDEVDVPEFERIKEVFSSGLLDYDFYLKDTVSAKDFIDTEIMFPTGAFSLPRKGKISVGYTSPPISFDAPKVLDSTNTTKPDQTRIRRSINKYFYNNVLFQFNEAVVDDLFLSGDLEVNQESKNRIKIGNKTLVVKARGLRPSPEATTIVELLKRKFQDKYKFGAESISMFAFYGTTFDTDIGDVVVFGDSTLQLPDTKKGSRSFSPRLFEVANKSLSIKSGEVKLELIDSGYSLENARYGVVSPSSIVGVGSTLSTIKIINSYETVAPRIEKQKWKGLVGQKIIVHDEDWDFIAETVLVGFSDSDNYLMLVDPALPWVPASGYVIDVAQYPATNNPEDNVVLKRRYVYTNPTVDVVSGASQTQFDVAPADIGKFLVGASLMIHDIPYDIISNEVKVLSVLGNTVTTDEALGFTPLVGYEVELIGFLDSGAPYRFL